jgi:DNA transposition AAA+ family ATPase
MENALKQVRTFLVEGSNQASNHDDEVRTFDKSSKNNHLQENDVWLSMREGSNLLGVSEAAIRKVIKKGKYRAKWVDGNGGRQYRIALSSLPIEAQRKWASMQKSGDEGEVMSAVEARALAEVPEYNRRKALRYLEAFRLIEGLKGETAIQEALDKAGIELDYKSVMRERARYREQGILGLIGVSGIGKTTAIRHIAKTRPGVIVVEAYQGMTKKAFIQVIAKQCGAIPSGGFTELFHGVVEALRDSERLIIVDEAEHLPVQALDAARRIHDFTRCGVLMVGLPRFYELLANRQRDYGYIYNRTGLPVRLKKLNEDDVRMLVDTVVPCNGYSELLVQACRGVARDLKTIVFEALRVADENGVSVEDKTMFPTIVRKVQHELNRREG